MARLKAAAASCAIGLASVVAWNPAVAQEASVEARELRDRVAIHELLLAYGRTLDQRDFDAFGALFTEDGEYGGAKGPEAIAESMRGVFAANPLGLREPAFHVFFNETIDLEGDRAASTSMSFYVAPDDLGGYRIVMMAAYEDELVKIAGEWKFRRRAVKALTPSPPGG